MLLKIISIFPRENHDKKSTQGTFILPGRILNQHPLF